jgi:hypothetical protein
MVEAAGVEPATIKSGPLIPKYFGQITSRINPEKGGVCGVLRRSCGEENGLTKPNGREILG